MSNQPTISNNQQEQKLILIVDDDIHMLSLYAMLLEQFGYRIQTAANGCEALKIVLRARTDIVLSDFTMPIMNGAELCRKIRANPDISSTPFILWSGGTLNNEMGVLCDRFFKKPTPVDELVTEIQRLLVR